MAHAQQCAPLIIQLHVAAVLQHAAEDVLVHGGAVHHVLAGAGGRLLHQVLEVPAAGTAVLSSRPRQPQHDALKTHDAVSTSCSICTKTASIHWTA
jgi:hypothetical protein